MIINPLRLIIHFLINIITILSTISPNLNNELGSERGDSIQEKNKLKNPFLVMAFSTIFVNICSLYNLLCFGHDQISLVDCILLSLVFGGFILRMYSSYTLGPYFTFNLGTRKDHKLIKSGPYKYLLHPSYTGIYMMTIGSLLFFNLNLMFVSLLIFLNFYYLHSRIIVEESILENKFGLEFTIYKRTRKRIIPFIY